MNGVRQTRRWATGELESMPYEQRNIMITLESVQQKHTRNICAVELRKRRW